MLFDVLIEALKAMVLGIVEGVTEWLPISSTGHMILVDEFIQLNVSPDFLVLFLVVIQIGSIMAVIVSFFHKLNPFSSTKTRIEQRNTWRLWGMVAIGCIPAAVFGIIFDEWVNQNLYNAWVVAAMLIVYGVIFIIIERRNRRRAAQLAEHIKQPRGKHAKPITAEDSEKELFKVQDVNEVDWKMVYQNWSVPVPSYYSSAPVVQAQPLSAVCYVVARVRQQRNSPSFWQSQYALAGVLFVRFATCLMV